MRLRNWYHERMKILGILFFGVKYEKMLDALICLYYK